MLQNDWPVLMGKDLTLTPTTLDDAESLVACADESTFDYFLGRPASLTVGGMRHFLDAYDGRPYTMRRKEGNIVGCSSFIDIKPVHRALEIGSTWIAPDERGTAVNPEAKLLMLTHAFEALGCVRVQLKCDARNERSAAAIAKLGAVFEGRLRNFGILSDGFVRDTLMFSITATEWPEVRGRLERRLVG